MSDRDPQAGAFSERLFDLLSTLESGAVIGLAQSRVRGLGQQLAFACSALGCSEALALLETDAMGRLVLPVVASPGGFRESGVEVLPEGTPIAHTLAGGGAQALSVEPDDSSLGPLLELLDVPPTSVLFAPIRLGDRIVGALALFEAEGASFDDAKIELAERLAEVVALTVEAFFTERMLFELFAQALPDLLGPTAATSLPKALERHIHRMHVAPEYRSRLALALAVGRVASRTDAEARLARRVLDAFEKYMIALEGGASE